MTRSALICAPAIAAAAAAAPTCAGRSVTLPATHTPGTSVRPVGSAGTYSPTPLGCSTVRSPRPVRRSARATIRVATTTASRRTTLPSRRPDPRQPVVGDVDRGHLPVDDPDPAGRELLGLFFG